MQHAWNHVAEVKASFLKKALHVSSYTGTWLVYVLKKILSSLKNWDAGFYFIYHCSRKDSAKVQAEGYRDGGGFVCHTCLAWLTVSSEFWIAAHNYKTCRAWFSSSVLQDKVFSHASRILHMHFMW
jgi:hypothetical protein